MTSNFFQLFNICSLIKKPSLFPLCGMLVFYCCLFSFHNFSRSVSRSSTISLNPSLCSANYTIPSRNLMHSILYAHVVTSIFLLKLSPFITYKWTLTKIGYWQHPSLIPSPKLICSVVLSLTIIIALCLRCNYFIDLV